MSTQESAGTAPTIEWAHREDMIGYLIRQEFPGTNASPILGEGRDAGRRWQQRQDAMASRRAELQTVPDNELSTLFEEKQAKEQEQDRIRREKQTPAAHKPDADFWIREDEWDVHNAALLVVDLEPSAGLGLHIKKILRDEYGDGPGSRFVREDQSPRGLGDEARQLLHTAKEIIRRMRVAHRRGGLVIEQNDVVEPRSFLRWARAKHYDIPVTLQRLIADGGADKRTEPEDDPMLRVMQDAYNQLRKLNGKPPSQRAVSARSGYGRNSERFKSLWPRLNR